MKRIYNLLGALGQLLRKVKRRFTHHWSRRRSIRPGVFMLPNPCLATDALTLHLHGLRSCPLRVEVRSRSGELVLERQLLPLSNHHRQPLTLPRDTPAGMYHCVALQPGGLPLKAWLALMD